MTKPTQDELIDIATRMAQELQEFIDEAERAGCKNPLPGTRALINEWEALYSRTDLSWQNAITDDDNVILGI